MVVETGSMSNLMVKIMRLTISGLWCFLKDINLRELDYNFFVFTFSYESFIPISEAVLV